MQGIYVLFNPIVKKTLENGFLKMRIKIKIYHWENIAEIL